MTEKKDTYGDEDFIYMIAGQQKRPKHENNIHDGFIVINGDTIPFMKRRLIGDVSMMMPEEYKIMSKERIEKKYGAKKVPDIVYTFNDDDVHMALSCKYKLPSKDEDVVMLKGLLAQLTMDETPQPDDEGNDALETTSKPVAYLDFASETNTLIFLFTCKANLAIGSIECVNSDMDEWKPVLLQMLESI